MRGHVLPDTLLQRSPDDNYLALCESDRVSKGPRYGWEIHRKGASIVVLDYIGFWRSFKDLRDKKAGVDTSKLDNIEITVHDAEPGLVESIQGIVLRYPRSKAKKT